MTGQQGYREAIEMAIAEWAKRQGLSLVTPISDQVLDDLANLIAGNLTTAGLIDRPQQHEEIQNSGSPSVSGSEHSEC